MKRGSRARRQRQLARLQTMAALSGYRPDLDWSTVPRKLIGWHRAALRRRMGVGWLFWLPLSAEPEAARQEFTDSWVSLGAIEEGLSESWTPIGKTPAGHFWVQDELAPYRAPYMGGGVIDGPRGRVDWVSARKPGDA